MSFRLFFNEPCPKCHKPLMQGVIEPHPSNPAARVLTVRVRFIPKNCCDRPELARELRANKRPRLALTRKAVGRGGPDGPIGDISHFDSHPSSTLGQKRGRDVQALSAPSAFASDSLPAPAPAPTAAKATGAANKSHNEQEKHRTDRRVDDRSNDADAKVDAELR
jgi:hypothetical protein